MTSQTLSPPSRRPPRTNTALGFAHGIFAIYAFVYLVTTSLGPHRVWASCAAAGYTCAAVLSYRRHTAAAVTVTAVGTAALIPAVALIATQAAQLEVSVVSLIRTGSPYVPDPATLSEYNPYGPMMALFGIPSQAFPAAVPGIGDPRVWFTAYMIGCVIVAVRLMGIDRRPSTWVVLGTAVAAPVTALTVATSGIDLPIVGCSILGLTLAFYGRTRSAAIAFGFGLCLKWTVIPIALAALIVVAHRFGTRRALRCASLLCAVSAALSLPAIVAGPRTFFEHTVLFPLGLADTATPAGTSLVGGVLAALPAGQVIVILTLAAVAGALGWYLLRRTPRTLAGVYWFAATGMTLLFLLAPTSRPGYFVLPLWLVVMAVLAGSGAAGRFWTAQHPSAGTKA